MSDGEAQEQDVYMRRAPVIDALLILLLHSMELPIDPLRNELFDGFFNQHSIERNFITVNVSVIVWFCLL